jgi:alpha-amylase
MLCKKFTFVFLLILFLTFNLPAKAIAADQPVAIFHAFNQNFNDINKFQVVSGGNVINPLTTVLLKV